MGLGKKAVVGALFEAGGDLDCLWTNMLKRVALDERRNAALLGWLLEMVATSALRCFEKLEDRRCKASCSVSGRGNQANDTHVLSNMACSCCHLLCLAADLLMVLHSMCFSCLPPMMPPALRPSDAGRNDICPCASLPCRRAMVIPQGMLASIAGTPSLSKLDHSLSRLEHLLARQAQCSQLRMLLSNISLQAELGWIMHQTCHALPEFSSGSLNA